MKISLIVALAFGLVLIFSKTSIECRQLEEKPSDFSLQDRDNKFVHTYGVGGRSVTEESKKDINNLGEAKGTIVGDSSLGYSFGTTKDYSNENAKNNDNGDMDPLATSLDTHFKASSNTYKMKCLHLPNLCHLPNPKHP